MGNRRLWEGEAQADVAGPHGLPQHACVCWPGGSSPASRVSGGRFVVSVRVSVWSVTPDMVGESYDFSGVGWEVHT